MVPPPGRPLTVPSVGVLAGTVGDLVREIEVAGGVDGGVPRGVELGRGGRTPIAQETSGAVAGVGRDDSARVDLADLVVAGVADKQITRRVHCNSSGVLEVGRGCRSTVTG